MVTFAPAMMALTISSRVLNAAGDGKICLDPAE